MIVMMTLKHTHLNMFKKIADEYKNHYSIKMYIKILGKIFSTYGPTGEMSQIGPPRPGTCPV